MRLKISAIGAKPGAPESALIEDYVKRTNALGRNMGFTGPTIETFDAQRSLSGLQRQKNEGALLLSSIPTGAHIVALDERGDTLNSRKFALRLGQWRDDGISDVTFLIGGADGHDPEVTRRATFLLSFGALTWPHMLARVMLSEQLYRAMTILSGHPYHRS